MLTVGEIAAMRQTAARAFPDICAIQRKTLSSDGAGGYDETWLPIADGVPCRIDPLEGGERANLGATADVGDRPQDETTHVVTMYPKRDVTEADRVVIDGQVYEVTLVRQRGAWELTRRLEVKEAP